MTGDTFLIYTTEQGGFFKSLTTAKGEIRKFSEEEYEELKESGVLDVTPPSAEQYEPRAKVRPVLVMLARIEDNHDFVLGCSREQAVEALLESHVSQEKSGK